MYNSDLLFGADGQPPQRTFVADSLLPLPKEQAQIQIEMTRRIGEFIRLTVIDRATRLQMISPEYNTWLENQRVLGTPLYFGLDLYSSASGTRIIEVNSHPQSFAQEDRARHWGLDIEGFPTQLVLELFERGYRNIDILGSTKNAFWRSHVALAVRIAELGGTSNYLDISRLTNKLHSGNIPDVVIRLMSNTSLQNPAGENLMSELERYSIPMFNSPASVLFGYRQMLDVMQAQFPDMFPEVSHRLEDFREYCWLKLDGPNGYAFVTNLNMRRDWEREIIFNILSKDFVKAQELINIKDTSVNLTQLQGLLDTVESFNTNWILQKPLEPYYTNAVVNGKETPVVILHRTTGLLKLDGTIETSHEAYGVTLAQFKQAKGKINGGSGFYIHPVVE